MSTNTSSTGMKYLFTIGILFFVGVMAISHWGCDREPLPDQQPLAAFDLDQVPEIQEDTNIVGLERIPPHECVFEIRVTGDAYYTNAVSNPPEEGLPDRKPSVDFDPWHFDKTWRITADGTASEKDIAERAKQLTIEDLQDELPQHIFGYLIRIGYENVGKPCKRPPLVKPRPEDKLEVEPAPDELGSGIEYDAAKGGLRLQPTDTPPSRIFYTNEPPPKRIRIR